MIGTMFADEMNLLGLKPPRKKINPRARFYFTEKGWDEIGRNLYDEIARQGYKPKIECRKNPKRSDCVYRDAYQVAILFNE